MMGANSVARQEVPNMSFTQETSNKIDRKQTEVEKLTQKVDKVTDFLFNQLGKIIEEQIKRTLWKEKHTKQKKAQSNKRT
ncbi:hypothetical protein C0J52_15760 [Blattella germanica]|nr:hypothetical protein C0J52_15760 [Blattella germanica]